MQKKQNVLDKKTQRNNLRKQLRKKRNALPTHRQKRAAQKLALRLSKQLFFKKARTIAFYLASDGEIDPGPLLKIAQQKNKICLLPAINKKVGSKTMHFVKHTQGGKLKKNKYGIKEPTRRDNKFSAHQIDLLLIPLVGFDKAGNRIGMGGGYYDRALSKKNNILSHQTRSRTRTNRPSRPHKTCRLLGLAHQIQEIELLPTENWDIPLDAIATDKEIVFT